MPELPEVETVRRGLEKLLPGKEIAAVDFDWPKSFTNTDADTERFMRGAQIKAVRRRAKVLLIDLGTDYTLVIHLKMTGQLVFVSLKARFGAGHPNDSLVGALPDRSTRVTIDFADGTKLFFNDQRKFGWMRLMPTLEVSELDFFKKVGPEPLASDFTAARFLERLRKRDKSSVKAVLLDQAVIAGVGNIYADESLFAARIHPTTKVGSLSDARLCMLHKELVAVLKLSIEKGGSTDRNYVSAEGKRGSYLTFAKVFRKDGEVCTRCKKAIIQKLKVAGRGTHVCPHCQKKGRG